MMKRETQTAAGAPAVGKKNKKRKAMKAQGLSASHRASMAFYICLMAWPILQFAVFYIAVNAQSILMAFQEIDASTNTTTWTFRTITDAFKSCFSETSVIPSALRTSLLAGTFNFLVSNAFALFAGYYIYKKRPGSSVFRVILFLPSIISVLALTVIYKYFINDALPELMNTLFHLENFKGLLDNPDTRFAAIMFFTVWAGFGPMLLIYSNAMSGVSNEVIEAAKLDGCSEWKQFIHIVLPAIYPTITTYSVVGVAGIFTNQFNVYSFYEGNAPEEVMSLGYYLYRETQSATKLGSLAEYPRLAALGLLISLVVIPLTFLVKWLMEKYGPSED